MEALVLLVLRNVTQGCFIKWMETQWVVIRSHVHIYRTHDVLWGSRFCEGRKSMIYFKSILQMRKLRWGRWLDLPFVTAPKKLRFKARFSKFKCSGIFTRLCCLTNSFRVDQMLFYIYRHYKFHFIHFIICSETD